jgi:hypothetical protein
VAGRHPQTTPDPDSNPAKSRDPFNSASASRLFVPGTREKI